MMRLSGYIPCMGRWEMHTKFWFGSLKRRYSLEVIGIDGKIIFKWILRKRGWRLWTGFAQLRIGTSGRLLEHGMNLLVP
jgi:hypothetical protein